MIKIEEKQPFTVLAIYHPKVWRGSAIGAELTRLTRDLGFKPLRTKRMRLHKNAKQRKRRLHADVTNQADPNTEAASWHQDGDLTLGFPMNHAIVVWCNRAPTEFEYDGRIYRPKPFQVVIARNLACRHRQPPAAAGRRWFFRQRVELPTGV